MTLSRPDAILFDWDNTLVNTWPTIHASLNHVLDAMGHAPWSMEKVQSEVKQSMRDSFPILFGDRWEEAANLYQTQYRSVHLDNLEALPAAEKTLQWVKDSSAFVGIVSNKKGPTLREEVAYLGWDHFFDSMIGAQDAEQDKPHPAPVSLALQAAHLPEQAHIWFIGDSVIDIECAHNTGCAPVLYGPKADLVDNTIEGFPFAHHTLDHAALQRLLQEHLS